MKNLLPAAAVGFALTAAAIGLGSATANASVNYSNESGSQATADLQSKGYTVQYNGPTNGSDLSRCQVTGVDGLSSKPFGTVYVDLNCPLESE